SGRVAAVGEVPGAHRRTKRYALLAAGRSAVEAWRARPPTSEAWADELHVKLAVLFERGDRAGALRLLELRTGSVRGLAEALRAARRAPRRDGETAAAPELALALVEAELVALAELRRALDVTGDEAPRDAAPQALSGRRSGGSANPP